MAGLSLGISSGWSTPSPALPPSSAQAAPTISSRAYGTYGAGAGGGGGSAAAVGSVSIGIAATVVLVWLWWSLPR